MKATDQLKVENEGIGITLRGREDWKGSTRAISLTSEHLGTKLGDQPA